jgi:hypothetical protein
LRGDVRTARSVQAAQARGPDDHSDRPAVQAGQVLYVYTKDAEGKIHSRRDIGVFFIPMTGAISKNAPVRPEVVSDRPPVAKPVEDQAIEAKPVESKPVEAKPAESKPASE